MKKYQELSGKEKVEYIAILILYPFLLLFGQMGKTIKLFGTKRRQIIASVLSFAMILTMLPITALAAGDTFTAPITVGSSSVDCTYKILTEPAGGNPGTVQIGTGTSRAIVRDTVGALTIPESVTYGANTYTVTEIGARAFEWCYNLSGELVIPKTITTIQLRAFFRCGGVDTSPNQTVGLGLTGLSFAAGSSLTTIENYAFSSCSKLDGILEIPTSVTTIGEYAFTNCTSLDALSFAKDSRLTSIGQAAFNCCTGLSGVLYIPSGVATIADYAFYDCGGLTAVKFQSNTLPIMGTEVFKNCDQIEQVFVPHPWTGGDSVTLPGIATAFTTAEGTLVKGEQFNLAPGNTYYFDLSSEKDNVGTVNAALPDTTLHYVPFTYTGTVNAYSLTDAMATTEEYAVANRYGRSLFVGDYVIDTNISWDSLNAANLIFGKTFDTNYKLRSLSMGSSKTGSAPDGSDHMGQPDTNEWDQILAKSGSTHNKNGWIKNWGGMISWGQDIADENASNHVVRGGYSAPYLDSASASNASISLGFRPVLEVLNPTALDYEGLKAVTLNLNGGKLKDSTADINIICAEESYAAPSIKGLTAPTGNEFKGWKDTNGTTIYAAGEIIPNTVTGLTAQWAEPEYSFTENFDDITTLAQAGWTMKNNSSFIGTTGWFQGNPVSSGGPFGSYNGAPNSYIAANFNNTTGSSTISNWLITPKLFLTNGSTLSFYTRKVAGQDYPDRLEVRLSTSGANPGTAPNDVGDFTTLILSINPDLVTGVYPTAWTKYTATVSDLSEAVFGHLAFRYFVTSGGPSGNNSDYIGIDTASYTPGIDFTASGYSGTYDANPHGINLNVRTPGTTMKYRTTADGAYDLTTAPTFSDVGTYTVWYQFSKDGYNTVEGSKTVEITPKELTVNLAVSDKNYDGLDTATYSTVPSLIGVSSGDQISLVNGTPSFSSVSVGSAIPINFTSFSITGEDVGNYSLIQPKDITANIIEGFSPVKDTHYTATPLNGGWTNTDFVITSKPGFQVSLTNTAEGSWQNSLPAYTAETSNDSVTFHVKDTATGEISTAKAENYKIDRTAPTGDIKIGENSFKTFLNTITFGLFFKTTTDVTITAEDTSGEDVAIAYTLSETELTDFGGVSWTSYASKITLTPNRKVIVYAKLTDKAGNVTIINSDGVVLFTDTSAVTTSVSFTKTETADVTATVNLNGNTIKEIGIGGNILTKDTDYTVSGGTISLKAAYLDTLTAGNYTVSVSFSPLGETGTPKLGSDTPAVISIGLTVSKAVPVVLVTTNPTGSQTRPNSVTLSANLPTGATGTLQFKANGNNIGTPVAVGQTVTFTASDSENSYAFMVYYSGDDSYEPVNASVPPFLFVKGEQDALSFGAETPTEKTYGDTAFSVTATGGSGTGTVTYSVVSGPATLSGNTVALTGTGSVVLRATKASDNDYNEKSVETTIIVSKKQITITGVTAESKPYDGDRTATVSGVAVINGKVNGDTVSISSGTATFADKTVGDGKTVTFTGFTLSGTDVDKYILTAQPANVTANITAKSITIDVSIQSKAYDGLDTATIASASLHGVVAGDTVSLVSSYPTATFTNVSAANNIPVDFSGNFVLTGADAGNYTLTQPGGITGNITNSYNAVRGTDYTVNQTGWSNTDFVVTAKPGFELSLTDTVNGVWGNSLTKGDETAIGSLTFYVRNKSTGAISLAASESYQIDKTAPTGDIKIGTNSIKQLLNTVTFGLFFKETQSITITSDNTDSDVASVVYKLSSTVLDENAVRAISDWTAYTDTFTVEPDCKVIVYAKLTDRAGNILYLGSNGLVLDSTSPVISGIENGKTYCAAVTVTVTDENFDTVTVDGTAATLTDGKLILFPTGTEQTVIATDKSGNATTVKVTVYDGHAWDEGIITTAPTASKKGLKTYICAHCGETKTEEIPMLAPSVTKGQNSNWNPNEGDALTFKSDAAFSDFINVLVDGKETPATYYELKEGSIIVTLKADYLATLTVGTHTLGIKSVAGTASTEFTVMAKEENKPSSKPSNTESPETTKPDSTGFPDTGDNSNMLLLFALLFVSGITAVTLGIKTRKRRQ